MNTIPWALTWSPGGPMPLHLSNPEIERLNTIVRQHMRPHLLAQAGGQISRRAIYRFFRATGPDRCGYLPALSGRSLATLDLVCPRMCGLASWMWLGLYWKAYWEQPEQSVSPAPLISGHDLINLFHLAPGSQIGSLLEQVREAQAIGEIQDRQQLWILSTEVDSTLDAHQLRLAKVIKSIALPTQIRGGQLILLPTWLHRIRGRFQLGTAGKSTGSHSRGSSLPRASAVPDLWGRRLPSPGRLGSSGRIRQCVRSARGDYLEFF